MLEYDDVMNEQRRVVYKYRREILEGRDMSDVAAARSCASVVERVVAEYTPGEVFEDWDLAEMQIQASSSSGRWRSTCPSSTRSRRPTARSSSRSSTADAIRAYGAREEEFGAELMRELERQILLRIIDNRWREHLYEMDYLREGIHLRGFAQIDPLVAYKNEGFAMFEELMNVDLGGVRPR